MEFRMENVPHELGGPRKQVLVQQDQTKVRLMTSYMGHGAYEYDVWLTPVQARALGGALRVMAEAMEPQPEQGE